MFSVGKCLIRDRRLAKGWTQLQLEEKSGVRTPDISAYENEVEIPMLPKAKAIAYALDCTIDELFEWEKVNK